tara:strand:+ start:39376 stop:40506 length:1131 start_codon:yes stop_codon:yes gene_type:complete
MTVLHVITGLIQGGAERALYNLIMNSKNECKHIVISLTDEGYFGSLLERNGIECFYLKMPRRRLRILSLFKMYKLIKKINPNIVQTWMYHADLIGGLISYFAGIQKIYWGVHNFNLDKNVTPITTIITSRLCALFSNFIPTKIIICSKNSIPVHTKIGYKNNFEVINLGTQLSKFKFDIFNREKIRKKFKIKKNSFVMCCVARWDIIKDHENLIKSLSFIDKKLISKKNIYLLLIGNNMNNNNKHLNEIISNNSLNNIKLKLLGSRDNMNEIYSAIDLHILPSKGEAFPNVICEAMSSGAVCIGTKVGDVNEIIGDTGWLVERSNPKSLGNALTESIQEFEDVKKWSKRKLMSRKRIEENFGMKKMVKNYIDNWTK